MVYLNYMSYVSQCCLNYMSYANYISHVNYMSCVNYMGYYVNGMSYINYIFKLYELCMQLKSLKIT